MAKTRAATKTSFYAVSIGRKVGVFLTWDECKAQIDNYPGAKYKKFDNAADAEAFVAKIAGASDSVAIGNTSTYDAVQQASPTSMGRKKKRGLSPDVENEADWLVVYSDGACKGNGKLGSIAGVGVWWGPDDSRNIAERCPGDQTNNRAELIAIARVFETAPLSKQPLLIKTDSQYSIRCFRDWLSNWRRNGFKAAAGGPVKNGPIIKYISALLDQRSQYGQKHRLQYVKGHSGNVGNDGADYQANLGTKMDAVEELDWNTLEAELRARLNKGEFKSSTVTPTPLEIAADEEIPAPEAGEAPRKVRRVGTTLSTALAGRQAITSRTLRSHVMPTSKELPPTVPVSSSGKPVPTSTSTLKDDFDTEMEIERAADMELEIAREIESYSHLERERQQEQLLPPLSSPIIPPSSLPASPNQPGEVLLEAGDLGSPSDEIPLDIELFNFEMDTEGNIINPMPQNTKGKEKMKERPFSTVSSSMIDVQEPTKEAIPKPTVRTPTRTSARKRAMFSTPGSPLKEHIASPIKKRTFSTVGPTAPSKKGSNDSLQYQQKQSPPKKQSSRTFSTVSLTPASSNTGAQAVTKPSELPLVLVISEAELNEYVMGLLDDDELMNEISD